MCNVRSCSLFYRGRNAFFSSSWPYKHSFYTPTHFLCRWGRTTKRNLRVCLRMVDLTECNSLEIACSPADHNGSIVRPRISQKSCLTSTSLDNHSVAFSYFPCSHIECIYVGIAHSSLFASKHKYFTCLMLKTKTWTANHVTRGIC